MKKLYRSEDNKIIFGIIGGLGEYYKTDPTFLRFLYIVLMFATGLFPLVFAYFVAYFIIPKRPDAKTVSKKPKKDKKSKENK